MSIPFTRATCLVAAQDGPFILQLVEICFSLRVHDLDTRGLVYPLLNALAAIAGRLISLCMLGLFFFFFFNLFRD